MLGSDDNQVAVIYESQGFGEVFQQCVDGDAQIFGCDVVDADPLCKQAADLETTCSQLIKFIGEEVGVAA